MWDSFQDHLCASFTMNFKWVNILHLVVYVAHCWKAIHNVIFPISHMRAAQIITIWNLRRCVCHYCQFFSVINVWRVGFCSWSFDGTASYWELLQLSMILIVVAIIAGVCFFCGLFFSVKTIIIIHAFNPHKERHRIAGSLCRHTSRQW